MVFNDDLNSTAFFKKRHNKAIYSFFKSGFKIWKYFSKNFHYYTIGIKNFRDKYLNTLFFPIRFKSFIM